MGKKIVVGPVTKGLKTNFEPFNIDNDSFPVLRNAYQWRGRVKRKRGTSFVTRLTRYFDSTLSSYTDTSTINLVNDDGNLITGWSLETDASIKPGSVEITDTVTTEVFTDPSEDGTLTGDMAGTGSINYANGDITLDGSGNNTISANFSYYPTLPVMGLRDFDSPDNAYPEKIGFDTTYSYHIISTSLAPNGLTDSYDVSFYKNPNDGVYTNYVDKDDPTPVKWNGQDYQLFYTLNYEGGMFATNGIPVPFDNTNIGMQFGTITNVQNIVAGPPATADLTITGHGLVVGDFVFVNEVGGVTGINFQTGYVTATPAPSADTVTVTFPDATLGGAYTNGGIAQYLTNSSEDTKDCIRYYDGDPTNGSATSPVLNGITGWVNFMPPLSQADFIIGDLATLDQYYLVGARTIIDFKDRLLFIGVVVQTSTGDPIYLQDTVVYSQNGSPYYTASFTGDVDLPTTEFSPILLPGESTTAPSFRGATPTAFFADSAGFGGFITAGISEPFTGIERQIDVVIIGSPNRHTRLVYTGNDIIPFNFFTIDNKYGISSIFSVIDTGERVLSRGDRGFVEATQNQVRRFDIDNPDIVFESNLDDNGAERIHAIQDFINEWIYFSYPSNQNTSRFPTKTFFFNFRDQTFATFDESYTCYGQFRRRVGLTWATVGGEYGTWNDWHVTWRDGRSTLLQPSVIAGNAQGYVSQLDQGTGEQKSLSIQNITGTGLVTSPDHCLNEGDYIVINNAIGTVASDVNGKVFSVANTSDDTFNLNPPIPSGFTYLGLGEITRMYVPFIQSKQFPTNWDMQKKTRLGVQQYLLTKTSNAQVQLLIYLSMNGDQPANEGPIFPAASDNDSLIYSSVLFTCPETTNIGLTPANTNINMQNATGQAQIWHRMPTSLIGDTVQFAITMSDEQMRDTNLNYQFAEIEFHGAILDVSPAGYLA